MPKRGSPPEVKLSLDTSLNSRSAYYFERLRPFKIIAHDGRIAEGGMTGSTAPVMVGGAKEQMLDILAKYTAPLQYYVGAALVIGIIYVRQIPASIRAQANSFIGRIFIFTLTIVVADLYSWVYGLLMAILAALLIAQAPRSNEAREGFQAGDDEEEVYIVDKKRKWFVESALKENPLGITEEKVKTSAVQDMGNASTNSSQAR
jgi:hypothetical protein